jgi:hypothetical protein
MANGVKPKWDVSEPRVKKICILVGSLLIGGLLMLFMAPSTYFSFIGLVSLVLGSLMLLNGYTEVPAAPQSTLAYIVVWERVQENDDGTTDFVSGTCLTAPYFPFNIRAVPIVMTKVDKDIPIELNSTDGIQMPGTISFTAHPNRDYLPNYTESGGFDNIWKIVDDMAKQSAKKVVTDGKGGDKTYWTCERIARNADEFSKQFALNMNTVLCAKEWGVEFTKVQINVPLPPDYAKSLGSRKTTQLDREGENYLHDSIQLQAEKMLKACRATGDHDVTLKQCIERIETQKIIDDGNANAAIIGGSGVTITSMNLGSKK